MPTRQQIEKQLSPPPGVAPVAGIGGGVGVGLSRIQAPDSGLAALAGFSDELTAVLSPLAQQRKDELRATARARVAGNGALVDELVTGGLRQTGASKSKETPEQARDRLRRIMRRAADAGIIDKADDPYFRIELLVATGERLARSTRQRAEARLDLNDHLDQDLGNGDVKPGVGIQQIWDEELARVGSANVLESSLASRAYAASIESAQAAVFDRASAEISNDQVRRQTQFKTEQITDAVLAAASGTPQDADLLLGPSSTLQPNTATSRIQELFDSNVDDARALGLQAVTTAAEFVAIEQPDRAIALLRSVSDNVLVNGIPISEDPILAIKIDEAIETLEDRETRDAAQSSTRHEARIREKTLALHNDVGKRIEAQITDEGKTPLAARDIVLRDVRLSLVGDDDFGILFQEAREYAEAVTAERASDPVRRDAILARLADAETDEDVLAIQAEIDVHQGRTLFGQDLIAVKREADARLGLIRGGALGTDSVYSSYASAMGSMSAPDSLPAARRNQVDEQLRGLKRRFVTQSAALAQANGGKVPPVEMERLGMQFVTAGEKIVSGSQAVADDAVSAGRRDAEAGMRPEALRQKHGEFVSTSELDKLTVTTADIAIARQRLRTDREVLDAKNTVMTLVGSSLRATGVDDKSEAMQVSLDEASTGFDAKVAEILDGMGPEIDYVDRRDQLTRGIRAFVAEERTRLETPTSAAVRAALGIAEGTEGAPVEARDAERVAKAVERLAADEKDIRFVADATKKTDAVRNTAENNPRLAALVPGDDSAGTFFSPLGNLRAVLDRVHSAVYPAWFGGGVTRPPKARRVASRFLRAHWDSLATPEARGKAAVAALAPLGGVTVDAVLSGIITVEPPWMVGSNARTRAAYIRTDIPDNQVPFDVADVPPYSTQFFPTIAKLEKFERNPRRDEFFAKLGVTTDQQQDAWVDAQTRLTNRFEANSR